MTSNTHAALCPKCQKIKSLAKFTHFLTRAEALAQGYAANVRVKVEGNVCNECRPKRKPVSQCSAKELANRVASGELSAYRASYYHQKLERRSKAAQREGGSKGQLALRKAAWAPILELYRKEVDRSKHALKSVRRKARAILEDKVSLSLECNQYMQEKDAFLCAYLQAARETVEFIKHRCINMPTSPKDARPPNEPGQEWTLSSMGRDRAKLRRMWAAIPPKARSHMRVPTAINNAYAVETTKGETP